MLCDKCGTGLSLCEFKWIRLKKVKLIGNTKDKIPQGKFAYSRWKFFCKPCAKKLTTDVRGNNG